MRLTKDLIIHKITIGICFVVDLIRIHYLILTNED